MKHADPRLPSYHCASHNRYKATCEPCRAARRGYELRRQRLAGYGQATLVDAIGARRRLSALMAIGWPLSWLASELDMTPNGLQRLFRNQHRTTRETHARVCALYDRMWNVHPVARTASERMSIARTLSRARTFGCEPPLAWDDTDLDAPIEPEGIAA